MRILLLPLTARFVAYTAVLLGTLAVGLAFLFASPPLYLAIPLAVFAGLAIVGTFDLIQKRHAILRNYPLTAHIRFILEEIRPEIRQYFLESEKDGTPFPRDKRAIVYQRAKQALDKRPFGTQTTFIPAAMSGCITRWRQSVRARIPSAWRSAAQIATSRTSPRSSTFPP